MPSSKYTQPPGPYLSPANIVEVDFHFDEATRKSLRNILPKRFSELTNPEGEGEPDQPSIEKQPHTIADVLIGRAEDFIRHYRTGEKIIEGGRPLTPASERAAIRRLLDALEPFRNGWLTEQTTELISDELYEKLERRADELENQAIYSSQQEKLNLLCASLGVILTQFAKANEVDLPRSCALDFVAEALDFAEIKYPDRTSTPGRLAALVFPTE